MVVDKDPNNHMKMLFRHIKQPINLATKNIYFFGLFVVVVVVEKDLLCLLSASVKTENTGR